MAKLFPIKTETACRLKWAWSSLYLTSGKTASCHRASIDQINEANFKDFHNTPKKIQARNEMLNGQWPSGGCEYCRDIEYSGGISDRMFQNQIPDVYPDILDQNPDSTSVEPSILEVFFSNTCNLKCVYCKSRFSSSIAAEENKFGKSILTEFEPFEKNYYKELIPLFWDWLKTNGSSLKRIQILGGESLLQKDFFTMLDYLEANPNPKLEFNIVTNLSVSQSIIESVASKLSNLLKEKKVGRVDIQVSVDCWAESQEYIRYGFSRELFDQNMKILLSYNQFRIGLLSTVCSLSIPDMKSLVYKFNEWSSTQEIFWYMHLVLPIDSVMSPTIFEPDFFVEKLNNVYNLLPAETWDQKQTLNVLSGIIEKIKHLSTINENKQAELISYLNEIDRRRGTDWIKAFPWLNELRNKNVV